MSTLPESTIKDIAKQIALGNTCYLQRYTGKVTTIDNTTEDQELITTQKETQVVLERKIESYIKIENLSAEDQFEIMKLFPDELSDRSIRKQLANALSRKNPVRNFAMTVENNMELKLHWNYFKAEEYQRWVSNFIIDAYNH